MIGGLVEHRGEVADVVREASEEEAVDGIARAR